MPRPVDRSRRHRGKLLICNSRPDNDDHYGATDHDGRGDHDHDHGVAVRFPG